MTWIIIGVVGLLVVYVIYLYNNFVRLVQQVKDAWSGIDVQLQRRYDLIPNLVETVKGYAAHERAVFEEVTNARARATQVHVDPTNITAEQIMAMAGAESDLTASLGRLLAVAEAYPDVKANQNFAQLQTELTDTENKIQAARRFYNSTVKALNTAVQMFPGNMIAGLFKFKEKTYFDLDDKPEVREVVNVNF